MDIDDDARQRIKTRRLAPIDVELLMKLGAPPEAFNEEGILDVDQLIDLGWKIDETGESPPLEGWDGAVHPDPDLPVPEGGGYV